MKNGILELERIARESGADIPDTLAVATPSGGFHLYFKGTVQGAGTTASPYVPNAVAQNTITAAALAWF